MAIDLAQRQRFAMLRNRPLIMLMLGHFTLDCHAGLLPVLYPLLIDRFGLSLTTVGLVSLAYVGASSISQPFFGWLADRSGTRLIGLALIWTTATFAFSGFAPSFWLLLLLAGAAGLGSGAYHPLGALNASAVIPAPQRNTAMSIYVTGGTLGVALGPLLGAALFSAFGTRGTAFMLLPGLTIGLWLIRDMRSRQPSAETNAHFAPNTPTPILPLLAVIGVMMSRTWTVFSIEAFIPTWYASLGYSPGFYGPLATTVVLASAVGTVGCGSLADRFGRRAVIIGALVITIPAVLLFAHFPGPLGFLSGALVGLSAASSGPLTLVMAQQLMSRRAGMASGLILGMGFVTGAVGVPITGMLADAFGMQTAIEAQVLLVVATIGLALLLPSEARLATLASRASPSVDLPAKSQIASSNK
jgi:MFS transporter, FSR family, fosmidomycin resistance protein